MGSRTLILLLMVMMMASARRDISDIAETDISHSFGTDLGQEIHPNRHRHHSHDIYIAGFFPTSPGYDETSIGQGYHQFPVLFCFLIRIHLENSYKTISRQVMRLRN